MRPSPTEQKVSVAIVSYNTRDLLRRAVASVAAEYEVVVVDNASSDGSVEMVRSEFPKVKVIANADNVGFGAANNQGIEAASGSLILLMNADAYAEPGAVGRLASVFGDPEVVAAGGRLLHPDGTLQESAAGKLSLWAVFCEQTYLEKLFKRSRLLSPYWLSGRLLAQKLPDTKHEPSDSPKRSLKGSRAKPVSGPSKSLGRDDHPLLASPIKGEEFGPFEVAQVMGACLMMRPVEFFDERFFLYCEDTELCRRLSRHGKILYVPAAVFHHELGAGSAARWEAVARYNRGKELFFRIHRGRLASCACFLLDRFGAKIRMVGWALAWLGLRISHGMRARAHRPFTPTPLSKSDSSPASPPLDAPAAHGAGALRHVQAKEKVGLFWKVVTAPVAGPPSPPRSGR